MRERISWALVAAGAAWAAWQGVGFALDPRTAHRAEAAWLIFAAALIGSRFLQAPRHDSAITLSREPPVAWLLLPVAAALLLYAPILDIGLLSDDFVLLRRARQGALIDGAWEFVRPLPLAAWWAIDAVLPASVVPAALHVSNATLHGLNGWLVLLIATRLGLRRPAAALSAALFLASPFQVEAVAWAAGIFDLTMTAFVLGAVAVALNVDRSPARQTAAITAFTIAAIASKETGVVAPMLIAVAGAMGSAEQKRAAWSSAAVAMIVVAAYVAWRLLGDAAAPLPEAGFIKHKLLTRPFGTLGFGIHRDVLISGGGVGLIAAIFWPIVLARAAWPWHRRVFTLVSLAAIWVLLSVAPLLAMFFVSDDLEGARYLYLGSTMWSVAMLAAIVGVAPAIGRPAVAVAVVVIAASATLVFAHQRTWQRAATVRDRVLDAATVAVNCDLSTASGLPDTEAGAYVFRNGFADAVSHLAGGTEPCAWDASLRQFRVESRP